MRRKWVLGVVGFVLVVLAGLGYWLHRFDVELEDASDVLPLPRPVVADADNGADLYGQAEKTCGRLAASIIHRTDSRMLFTAAEKSAIEILDQAEQTIPYLGMDDFDMATWRIWAACPGRARL